jgi:hypothetical protein
MNVTRNGSLLKQVGPLTQLVEYLPFKQRVAGSSPARPTILRIAQSGKRKALRYALGAMRFALYVPIV